MSFRARVLPRGFRLVGTVSIVLLFLYAFVTFLNLIAGFNELGLLLRIQRGLGFALEEVESSDLFRSGLAGLQTVALLVCIPFVGAWIALANVGARAIGATGMRFSPFASVAWFAVPIAYLWMPYRAVSEIWRAIHEPASWQSERAPILLRAWWGFWLLYMLSNRAVRALFRLPDSLSSLIWANVVSQLSDVFVGVAAILLSLVIKRVMGRLEDWSISFAQAGDAPREEVPAGNSEVPVWASTLKEREGVAVTPWGGRECVQCLRNLPSDLTSLTECPSCGAAFD